MQLEQQTKDGENGKDTATSVSAAVCVRACLLHWHCPFFIAARYQSVRVRARRKPCMFMQELPPVIWLFFLQMNILLLPDASVNREELYEVKLKSTTFFRSGVYRVITCARVNEFLVVWDLSFECKKNNVKIKAKTQHPCTALHRGQRNICFDLEVQRLGNNQCRTFKLLWPQPSPQKNTLHCRLRKILRNSFWPWRHKAF